MISISEHRAQLGVTRPCQVVGIARATYYRHQRPPTIRASARTSSRALSAQEKSTVLAVLHEPRFADLAPAEVYATLLDEGVYHCSLRTMYRVLDAHSEVRERRNQLRHGNYAAPELLATRPNEVWTWDITKLFAPAKWSYYYLYVIIDIYSRYVVGWMVAHRESAVLAERLIKETLRRQNVVPGQLTVHADRGSSMRSKTVAFMLADLGVTKTHSRPHVSNDNPFSESHFKTLKYRPDFPQRFTDIAHARNFNADFFDWYNHEHRHSGIGLLTPNDVHVGLAGERIAARSAVLTAAYEAHPERFSHGAPHHAAVHTAVWINKPKSGENSAQQAIVIPRDAGIALPPDLDLASSRCRLAAIADGEMGGVVQ